MSLNRCSSCVFHSFNDDENCLSCIKGHTPHFLVPLTLIDFFYSGWVSNCKSFVKLNQEILNIELTTIKIHSDTPSKNN